MTRRSRRKARKGQPHAQRETSAGGVVFRRGPDWRLMATMLDLRGALYGRRPVPADDIWLNDSDTVLLPKTPIQQADEFIEQVFTRGLYGVVPIEKVWNIDSSGSSL